MELYQEILASFLSRQDAKIVFPNLNLDAQTIVSQVCYRVLCEIQRVVRDDSLEDPECFDRIEEIISILERNGILCEPRHDFG